MGKHNLESGNEKRDRMLLMGGAALMLLGAGLMLANPKVRRVVNQGINLVLPKVKETVISELSAMSPEIKRYILDNQ